MLILFVVVVMITRLDCEAVRGPEAAAGRVSHGGAREAQEEDEVPGRDACGRGPQKALGAVRHVRGRVLAR